MAITNNKLHTQLQTWAKREGIDQPDNLSMSQTMKAAADLQVNLSEVMKLQEEMQAMGAGAAEAAGSRSQGLRDAVGDASGGRAPVNMGNSPALMGHQFKDLAPAGESPRNVTDADAAHAKAELANTPPAHLSDWVLENFGESDTMDPAKAKVAADLVRDYVSDFAPPSNAFERAAFDVLDALDARAAGGSGAVAQDDLGHAKAELANTPPAALGDWVLENFGALPDMTPDRAMQVADLVRDYVSDFAPPSNAFERGAFDILDQLDAKAAEASSGIGGIDPMERHEVVRSALWGNSFYGPNPGAYGPVSRHDFETNGTVNGWSFNIDTLEHERFSGKYEISDNGELSMKLDDGSVKTGQLDVDGDGNWSLKLDGAFGASTAGGDWNATPDDEPTVRLLNNPWWGPAPGAYGPTSKVIFDSGKVISGWAGKFDDDGNYDRVKLSGKWDFDHDAGLVTIELDQPFGGRSHFTGKLTDDGPVFGNDTPFAKMFPDGDFFSA
jgi:hypothetical protein